MLLLALRMLSADSDHPDARDPELHVKLSTSSVDCHNPEDVSSETKELTVQVFLSNFHLVKITYLQRKTKKKGTK